MIEIKKESDMVYGDQWMSVVIASIAEIGHDGEANLWITHRSGVRNQTGYGSTEELMSAYNLIQNMLVQYNTGLSIQENIEKGTVTNPTAPDLSLVEPED